jgi:hypothetical protein
MENKLEIKIASVQQKEEQWKRCQEWKTYVNYCGLYYKKECPMNCAYALNHQQKNHFSSEISFKHRFFNFCW